MTPGALDRFLRDTGPTITVRVLETRGSAPRDAGAWMIVAAQGMLGTIGGGRLEQRALAVARHMLDTGETAQELEISLGPGIGQCCGGWVRLALSRTDAAAMGAEVGAAWEARPQVYVCGAGHVGRALVEALYPLPFRTILVDSRAEELARVPVEVEARLTPLPEAEIAGAAPGAAYIVLTHDHGMDFLLTSAALARGDAAYVGLIGSATKRARFERWHGRPAPALTCPIGGESGDKRPPVIAALVVAEVVRALTAPPP